jgi:signal peptide peptidase SppA
MVIRIYHYMFSIFKIFKKKKIIPHIRLSGIIGSVGRFKQGINFAGQQEIIDKAFAIKKTLAIAISINSPGGSPVQSHLIYSYIKKLAKKNNKKVLVFAEDVAASGGYLIACAGDEIYANSSSIVGSIGVISASFGFQEAIKKIGVERRVYTAGKNKSSLDPFKEEKEEDIQRLKKIQLELHSDFIKVVEDSRGSKLIETEKNNTFTGEFWSGSTSLKLGLIDGIGNADQILKEKFGEDIVIKKLEKPKGFLAKKLSASIENQVDNIANVIEERSIWQRYGF